MSNENDAENQKVITKEVSSYSISKIIVFLFILALAYWVYPDGIGDIPFAELTLKKISSAIFAFGLVVYAFTAIFDWEF